MTTATACTAATSATGEALIGSAPDAIAWVCLEQNGPWGRRAWTESHLDADLGRQIETLAETHRVRPSLIRRPGRSEDVAVTGTRTVLVAHTHPERSWLLAGTVSSAESLLTLDWRAVAAGDLEAAQASLPALAPTASAQLLVCTNGTRDACCARLGRPVAAQAAITFPGRVWEVTHTSGHRFAATTVLLPSGTLHGRVLDPTALLTAVDRGQVELNGYRGRSTWSSGAQVAEDHIRRTEQVLGIDDLTVEPAVDAWTVRHRDGRSWWVAVSTRTGPDRPESCGKDASPSRIHTARTISGPTG
ncbi:MAG: sucrase ferredoxin [Propionibacteriales bacterium]|nr:sucrase ferredoxin [Propionibacteriales bacterium]